MSHSYSPAARSIGRRVRVTYAAALVLLLSARLWSVHSVHGYFGLDETHGSMAGTAGMLVDESTQVMHAAFVAAYTPESASADLLDRAAGHWSAQNAKTAAMAAPLCRTDEALCRHFRALELQTADIVALARAAAATGPGAGRNAAFSRLETVQGRYAAAARDWVAELGARFGAQIQSQQRALSWWAIAQVLATVLIVALIVEPLVRRLQRERTEGDRIAERQNRLVEIIERAGIAVSISDGKGRIEWVNQGFVRMTGHSFDSVAGRPQDEVLCGTNVDPAARAALRAAIHSGTGCQIELLKRAHDNAYWAQVDFTPIHAPDGVLTSFIAICTNVSDRKREQDDRQELLVRLQKMASQLPGMLYQYRRRPDGTTHFPYASDGIRELFGLSPESVRESSAESMARVHPDDQQRVREGINRSAEQLTHWRDEFRVCHKDGQVRWMLGNAAPEREADGGILWHGFVTDVTQRRIAMQAIADGRTLLQSVLDAATESAIIATDVNGRVTVFNSGAERMLQYQAAELIGRPDPLNLTYAPDQGEFTECERTLTRKDGTTLTVSLSVTAIRNTRGDVNGYLGVATDVTEKRQAREALQAAKETAERANRAKSEFLATMSHEIRTPMNGVLGFANLLRDTELNAEQQEFVRTIENSGQSLLAIINDILDFSKIEAGAMTLERIPFGLAEAVDEVMALMAGKADEKQLELRASIAPSVPARIVADPGRLKQILLNLVGNAIKFTSFGHVHVEVCAAPAGAGFELTIRVRDTGIGIAAAAQTALFRKFTQADASTTRRYGGTGLGLAICRQLVELMGGAIGLDSTPGAGSTFWFSLPVASADAIDAAAAAAASVQPECVLPASEVLRILVADDNSVNQMVAVRLLERLGCRCDVAGSGTEAVQMAAQLPYTMILMDCHMPEMDGFEATAAIRRRERELGLASTPIVALTASVLQEDRDRCASAGMNDFLGKPLEPAELARLLRRLVPRDNPPVAA